MKSCSPSAPAPAGSVVTSTTSPLLSRLPREHVVVAAPEEVLEQFAFAGVAERVEGPVGHGPTAPAQKDVATVAALQVAAAGWMSCVHGLRVGALAVLALAHRCPAGGHAAQRGSRGPGGRSDPPSVGDGRRQGADLVLGVSSDLVRGQSRLGPGGPNSRSSPPRPSR